MLNQTDTLTLRLLASDVEAARWQRCRANPLHPSERRATYAVQAFTRLSNRSLAYRTACAYFSQPLRQRRMAEAEAYTADRLALPQYTIADLGQRGVRQAYSKPASVAAPAYGPFASMVLEAVSHIRRWRWIAEADATPEAEPMQAPTTVVCRRCLTASYAAGLGCERC